MKTIQLILVLFLMLPVGCLAQSQGAGTKSPTAGEIGAYYFHNTTRCVTCRAVESEARQNIEILYPAMVKEGKISFSAYNLEEEPGKTLAKKLGVAGQSLILVKGTNKVDITNEGFLYARTNPDKLRSIMKDKIDGLKDL
jgi:hypothetical protein